MIYLVLLVLSLFGLFDSTYLTIEHFRPGTEVVCNLGFFSDCGRVLKSKYSEIWGIPLALMGVIHYGLLTTSILLFLKNRQRFFEYAMVVLSTIGLFVSFYLVYLQLIVIGAICIYCMGSALTSFTLFAVIQSKLASRRRRLVVAIAHFFYVNAVRPIFFKTQSDQIHESLVSFGQTLGDLPLMKPVVKFLFLFKDESLKQTVAGVNFDNPVGLAAGFDYEGKLTQILPSMGFGFQTIGTVTNMAYEGNPPPRLGRLPKSKSLMVNKGFKSPGAKEIIKRLRELRYEVPVGISIGRTNSAKLKTQKQSIDDIISAFNKFERSSLPFSYYELNISCPNLIHGGQITFYPPKNLEQLLKAVDKLNLGRPVFVKMPITESNRDTLAMLRVIKRHSPVGVIFGNLQKDRTHKSLDKEEVKKFEMGYFSGKPTWQRSNELISLCYKHFKNDLVIIGCGGVFSGADAYEKVRRGATLVQFITGMIFEGPQLASQINAELADLLKKDGFSHISQAAGKASN